MVEDEIKIDPTDDVFKGLVATTGGEIINARLRKALKLPELPEPASEPTEGGR